MEQQSAGHRELVCEVKNLRRKLEHLRGIERRCEKAETALAAVRQRNRLLGDSSPLGMFTVDTRGQLTGITRRMLEIFHWPVNECGRLKGLHDCPVVSQSTLLSNIHHCIESSEPVVSDCSLMVAPPQISSLRCYLSPVAGEEGIVREVLAIVEDCTDLKRTEEALRGSEKRYRMLFQSTPVPLIERDVSQLKIHLYKLRKSGISDLREYFKQNPDEVMTCWSLIKTVSQNRAFLDFMGIDDENESYDAVFPVESGIFRGMAREIILIAAGDRTAHEQELTVVTARRETRYVLGRSLAVPGSEQGSDRVMIALVDITERKRKEEALRENERRMREQSFRDGLTGLHNQRYLHHTLDGCVERALANSQPVSLIFMDLDHFKQVVDTYGHLNGSRTIRKVGATINSCLELPAYAVSYAGDEFVAVLPGMDQGQALVKASLIRSRIREAQYVLEQGVEVRVRASFGIAAAPDDATDAHGLISAADNALFYVKKSGRGSIGVINRQSGEVEIFS